MIASWDPEAARLQQSLACPGPGASTAPGPPPCLGGESGLQGARTTTSLPLREARAAGTASSQACPSTTGHPFSLARFKALHHGITVPPSFISLPAIALRAFALTVPSGRSIFCLPNVSVSHACFKSSRSHPALRLFCAGMAIPEGFSDLGS